MDEVSWAVSPPVTIWATSKLYADVQVKFGEYRYTVKCQDVGDDPDAWHSVCPQKNQGWHDPNFGFPADEVQILGRSFVRPDTPEKACAALFRLCEWERLVNAFRG